MKKKLLYIGIPLIIVLLIGVYYIYDHRNDYRYDSTSYQFGTTFTINGEEFYIFDYDTETVTGLASRCIDFITYKQSNMDQKIEFSHKNYWDDYVNNYPIKIKANEDVSQVFYMVKEYAHRLNNNAKGTLLTKHQYESIMDAGNNPEWLINSNYWLRNAYDGDNVYVVNNKKLQYDSYQKQYCVRPVIEIDKKYLDD